MGKSKIIHTEEPEPPRKRGRQAGAKTYNKATLFKIISQCKPTNMVVWATVAEQYRTACGELDARPAAVIKKFFFKKMCNSMRKPTGSSGDDMTSKCQALNRNLFQMEEEDVFGESDEDEYIPEQDAGFAESSGDEDIVESQSPSFHTPSAVTDTW